MHNHFPIETEAAFRRSEREQAASSKASGSGAAGKWAAALGAAAAPASRPPPRVRGGAVFRPAGQDVARCRQHREKYMVPYIVSPMIAAPPSRSLMLPA
jgi:hypothetical protein